MSAGDDGGLPPEPGRRPAIEATAATYGAMTMLALGFCNALQNGESSAIGNALDGIKHTFRVSDLALGVAAFIASVGASWGAVPIASLCNRHKRVLVLASMFLAWSAFMFLAGSVPILFVGMTGFVVFSFFRLMVSWMEATDPAAYPLITDYYPHDQRASRISVFLGVAAIGTALGVGLSGPIVDQFGWRGALYMWVPIGVFGAWLIGSQPEPRKGAQDAGFEPELEALEQGTDLVAAMVERHFDADGVDAVIDFPDPASCTTLELVKGVLKLRTWLFTAIAMGLAQMMQTGLMFWGLSYMKRTYHMSASQAGLITLALGPPGLLGLVLGGFVADRWLRRGVLRARVWTASGGYIGAGVTAIVAFSTTVEPFALVLLAFTSFALGASLGPSYAMLYDVTPAPLRAEGAALSDILMWPAALGSAIVGALSTLTGNLRVALGLTSPLFILGGVLMLLVGGKSPPGWAGRGYVRAVEEVVVDARRRAERRAADDEWD